MKTKLDAVVYALSRVPKENWNDDSNGTYRTTVTGVTFIVGSQVMIVQVGKEYRQYESEGVGKLYGNLRNYFTDEENGRKAYLLDKSLEALGVTLK